VRHNLDFVQVVGGLDQLGDLPFGRFASETFEQLLTSVAAA
jgi:hypothetical protein